MTNNYGSDLNDEEWAVISLLIPPCKTGGRPRQVNIRPYSQWYFLFIKNRLSMAYASSKFSSMRHSSLLF